MLWVILGIVAVVAIILVAIYNGLVKAKVRVDEAWSDITVQLKRRGDLIPNLVNTVKGYAKHEKGVFEEVTKARAAVSSAKGPEKTAEAENQFQSALKSLFAVAEAYPDLKANENFKHLQEELVDTEDKIQASRRFYNGSVRDLNTKIQVFPTNVLAGMMGFTSREFFEVDEGEKAKIEKPTDVSFQYKESFVLNTLPLSLTDYKDVYDAYRYEDTAWGSVMWDFQDEPFSLTYAEMLDVTDADSEDEHDDSAISPQFSLMLSRVAYDMTWQPTHRPVLRADQTIDGTEFVVLDPVVADGMQHEFTASPEQILRSLLAVVQSSVQQRQRQGLL